MSAHVGSPDVFFEGDAGGYHVVATIRPPRVIPGVADIEVRITNGTPARVLLLPMRLTGPGARLAPAPDVAKQSDEDPQFFTGHLWLMNTGAWQVRVRAEGARGTGEVAIPVTAVASQSLGMQRTLAVGFFIMMLVLAAGLVSILGASFREAALDPGAPVPAERRRAGRIAMAISTVGVVIILVLGNMWWDSEASAYGQRVYKPLVLAIDTDPRIQYRIVDPGWLPFRKTDDFIPDHDHLMHVFAFNDATGVMHHVHPRQSATGAWRAATEPSQPGRYRVFADVVHANGIPETASGQFALTEARERTAPVGDDSVGDPSAGRATTDGTFEWTDGSRMVRVNRQTPLTARTPTTLRFDVIDAAGQPARDLQLYMGMPAHAVIVKRDWSVFAHIHGGGSVPMAVLTIAQPAVSLPAHDGHDRIELPSTVSFPYGFPSAGEYRVYVQVKRAADVKTGVFTLTVH